MSHRPPAWSVPWKVPLTCSLAALALACGEASSPTSDAVSGASAALARPLMLACDRLTVNAGSIGAGETAAGLATRDLSGTQDVWDSEVWVSPATSLTCRYTLPSGATGANLSALVLRLNYRGPLVGKQKWVFEAYDAAAGSWVRLGDNTFATTAWNWTAKEFALPAPAARFVNGSNQLKIRYRSSGTVEKSVLDELVLLATPSTSTDGGSTGGDTTPGTSAWWKPGAQTSWQIQLDGSAVDKSVVADAYDVDLFDTTQADIDALHAAGRKVICYFSAGSFENWRPDASNFPAAALGKNLDGWPGERWLDTRDATVRQIHAARMDLAVQKKCDAVDPDNVDGYANGTGFPLTGSTQLDFNRFLADAAHARGLAVGLKNDVDQVASLEPSFDFAVNEECFRYGECATETPFVSAGKPVFQIEYGDQSTANSVCPKAQTLGLRTLVKKLALTAWRISCP
ncbi:MAG: hypothetical protein RL199_504 [Pseudomonadota bacterium]